MADENVPNAIEILQDLSKFPSLTDRLQPVPAPRC
jgi:hypothetical protein